ncbi:hypothetical protein ABPG74_005062 [Tetrahymena malaccensis]
MEQEGQQQIDYYQQSRQKKRIWTKIFYQRYSSGQVNDDKQHNASTDNSQIKTSNEEVQNDNHNNKPEEKYLSLLSESQISDIIQQFRQHNWRECNSLFENLEKYDFINYQNAEFKIVNEIIIQLKNITNVLATATLECEKDQNLVKYFLFVAFTQKIFEDLHKYRFLLQIFFDEICKDNDETFIKNCLLTNYLILFSDWQECLSKDYFSLEYFSDMMTSEEVNEMKIFKIGKELKFKNQFLYKQ